MPYKSINEPGIAKGFGLLADAFVKRDPNAIINADLAAKRRDGMITDNKIKEEELFNMRSQAGEPDGPAGLPWWPRGWTDRRPGLPRTTRSAPN
jgi:hypothetical protein